MNASRRILVSLFALVVTVGTLNAVAQTKSKSSSSKSSTTAKKKESSKYHRLPTFYGQLKLKEEQVSEIYEIKDDYGPRIEALLKEIEDLKEEQAEEIKDVLTRTQVTALNKLIAAGGSSGKSASSSKPSSSKSKSTRSSSSKKSSSKK